MATGRNGSPEPKRQDANLVNAANRGELAKVRGLLQRNNPKIDIESREPSYNYTALLCASLEGHREVVAYLLKQGADIEAKANLGFTPLLIASQNGNIEVVRLLITSGAEIEAKCYLGFTPLLVACQEGHIEVVRLLISSDAEIEAKTNLGFTPLLVACQNGHFEVVRLLISSGAHVRAKDKTGSDSLFMATMNGHLHVVDHLCRHGADTKAQDETGMTALANVASESGNLEIVRCLVGFGAKMAPPDTNSESRFLSTFIFVILSVSLVLSFSSGIFFLSCKPAAFVYE